VSLERALALKELNLNIRHGEFVCIIGDVGSGKSSFLNAIIGDLLYLDPEFIESQQEMSLSDEGLVEVIKTQTK
jgi:ABC-type uncharacterized transport system ATPase component